MPVKGICHAFQFVQSFCFLALAQFADWDNEISFINVYSQHFLVVMVHTLLGTFALWI